MVIDSLWHYGDSYILAHGCELAGAHVCNEQQKIKQQHFSSLERNI